MNMMDNIWKLNIMKMKKLGMEECKKQQIAIVKEAIIECQRNK